VRVPDADATQAKRSGAPAIRDPGVFRGSVSRTNDSGCETQPARRVDAAANGTALPHLSTLA